MFSQRKTLLSCLCAASIAAGAFAQSPSTEQSPVGTLWRQYTAWALRPGSLALGILSDVLILAVVAAAYYLATKAIARTTQRIEAVAASATAVVRRRSQRAITMLSLLQSIIQWVLGLIVVFGLLSTAGVNLLPVLTGAGILGVAVAFGSQALVKDIITGFFILLEGQYAVGDVVLIGGLFGVVRSVGMRTTVVEAANARVHYIPNGSIVQVTVFEHPVVRYLIDVPLANSADIEHATEALGDFARELGETFPAHVRDISVIESRAITGDLGLVRLEASILPEQDWLATEHIPASIKSLLEKLAIPMPEGRTPRAFAPPAAAQITLPENGGAANHKATGEEA